MTNETYTMETDKVVLLEAIKKLEDQLNEKDSKFETLSEEIKTLQDMNKNLYKAAGFGNDVIRKLNRKVSDLETRLRKAEGDDEEEGEEEEQEEEETVEESNEDEKPKMTLGQVKKINKQLVRAASFSQDYIRKINSQLNEKEDELCEVSEQVKDVNDENKKLLALASKNSEVIRELNIKLDDAESQLDELKEQIAQKDNEIQELKGKSKESSSSSPVTERKESESFTPANAQLIRSATFNASVIRDQTAKIDSLEDQLSEANEEVSKLKTKNSELEKQIQTLQSSIKEIESQPKVAKPEPKKQDAFHLPSMIIGAVAVGFAAYATNFGK